MSRFLSRVAGVSLLSGCLTWGAGCSTPNHPTAAGVEPVQPLSLTCPSDLRVPDVRSSTQAVTYPMPAHSGGVDPVEIACATPSGGSFPLGSTRVSCTGSDSSAPARTAACTFTVTLEPYVAPTPTISVTKFVAYGDSITAGEINDEAIGGACPEPQSLMGRPQARFPQLAYPALVQQSLASRYSKQTIAVRAEAVGGEETGDTGRFADVMRANRPEAVLFLEGVNDLANDRSIDSIIANIDADILEARRQGVQAFFLSTLTPVKNFSRGCYTTNAAIRAVNAEIRSLASRENVSLVDSWAAFVGFEDSYLDGDGLHPSAAGQQAIARAFFDVIVSKLEGASSSARR